MSMIGGSGRPGPWRRLLAVLGALCGVLLVGLGGSMLAPRTPDRPVSRVPLVGRVTTICTAASVPDQGTSTTGASAVVIRQAPGRAGTLKLTGLGSSDPQKQVTEQGKGVQVSGLTAPVLLSGEGVMATATSGVVFGTASTGVETGLSSAPCLAPATAHWFSGLGAGEADRTDLFLTNPDDAQAAVDLRFFGPNGRLVVAGSPGLTVDAHATRVLSLTSLVRSEGVIGVSIQAGDGRVAAVARRTLNEAGKPAGIDWQVPSSAPQTRQVVPGVPEGEGRRTLSVTNPTNARATAQIQVDGLQGPYAPSGAATVEIPPESTGTVDLAAGLLGEGGTVEVTADQPVTAAVTSVSKRAGAAADLAVQPSTPALVRAGVSALATTVGATSELVLSNAGESEAAVSFEVLSYDGVSLRTDDVLLGPHSTATRRLTSSPPSYLVVRVPGGSSVVGAIVLSQPDGDVAGLTTIPLTSPDVASRAPLTVPDPSAGR